jgi:hypothetical protein
VHASKLHGVSAGATAITSAQAAQSSRQTSDGRPAAAQVAVEGQRATARYAHAGHTTATGSPHIAPGQPSWTRGGLRNVLDAERQQPRPAVAVPSAPAQAPLSAFAQIGGTLPLRPYSPWPALPTQRSQPQAQQGHTVERFTADTRAAAASAATGSLRSSAPAALPPPSDRPWPGGGAQHAPGHPRTQHGHGQQQLPRLQDQARRPQCPLQLPPPDRRPVPPVQPHAQQDQQQHRQGVQVGKLPQQSEQQAAVQHLRTKMAEFRELAPHLPPPPPSHVKYTVTVARSAAMSLPRLHSSTDSTLMS